MTKDTWMEEFYPIEASRVEEDGAIKHSLVKWYGGRKENLKKHGLLTPPIEFNGGSCSLCQNFLALDCLDCPLYQFLGKPCFQGGCSGMSPFDNYEMLRDPEPMIAALEAIAFVEETCK